MPDSEPQSATNGSQPQPAAASLDPADWPAFRAQAHRMLDDMLGYTEGIREQPVWQKIPSDVRAQFRGELPAQPSPLQQVHEEFMTSILPFTARNGHPGFLGWVQGGGTPVGMMAELLAAGLNANLGGRDQIPLEVERQVAEWMRTLFGFPEGATGLFVTGTSMANFLAVKVARDARLGVAARRKGVNQAAQKLTAYASTAVHGCIARALDLAGLGSDSLRPVAVDSRHRIDLEALAHAVRADREAGLTPFLVVEQRAPSIPGPSTTWMRSPISVPRSSSGFTWTAPLARWACWLPMWRPASKESNAPTPLALTFTNGRRFPTTPASS